MIDATSTEKPAARRGLRSSRGTAAALAVLATVTPLPASGEGGDGSCEGAHVEFGYPTGPENDEDDPVFPPRPVEPRPSGVPDAEVYPPCPRLGIVECTTLGNLGLGRKFGRDGALASATHSICVIPPGDHGVFAKATYEYEEGSGKRDRWVFSARVDGDDEGLDKSTRRVIDDKNNHHDAGNGELVLEWGSREFPSGVTECGTELKADLYRKSWTCWWCSWSHAAGASDRDTITFVKVG